MFIKHGDGKIVSVIDEDELTEKQKKSVKDLSNQSVKISDDKSSYENKISGDN
jgi:hypothetical protein